MTVSDVYKYMDIIAPFSTQEEWDNSGLLIGSMSARADKIYVCLDVTDEIADKAIELGASLIISHHPVIFTSLSEIESESVIYRVIQAGISIICAHTNLDVAEQGVNDILCKKLGLFEYTSSTERFLRLCKSYTEYDNAEQLARECAEKLNTTARLCNPEKSIGLIAVCGGAGGSFIGEAAKYGADVLITGETKHHEYIEALHRNIAIITLGHYETEFPIVESLAERLTQAFPEAEIIAEKFKSEAVTVK